MDEAFRTEMAAGYTFDEPCLLLGRPMVNGEIATDVAVQLPLSMVNRHGLVAGATGTGKTKTLQIMAGQLSAAGVPVFVSDVKGDLTGIARPGDAAAAPVQARAQELQIAYAPRAHPVELLSLTGSLGAQVRATVSSFGPILLGKVLDLNRTQVSVLTLVFAFCDDERLPLLDLEDLRSTLRFLSSDEGETAVKEYGGFSRATIGVLLRSITELEAAGADAFFGEPEFDVADLMRTTETGEGVVSLLELADVMDRPRLFSTFMLWMLAQLYATLPEEGDLPKPKLAFFFDEAHLLFDDASEALLEQIELTARLIRSKGVGVYFVTQSPTDVPSSVLSQLGNRVQHALRAFTPDDETNLRKTVKTFPKTAHYDVGATLTSLGIGEALVTVLGRKGVPTPLAATMLIPPDSLMDAVDDATRTELIAAGGLSAKYAQAIDRESAHELITARLDGAAATVAEAEAADGGFPPPPPPKEEPTSTPAPKPKPAAKPPSPQAEARSRGLRRRAGEGRRHRLREGHAHDRGRPSHAPDGLRRAVREEVARLSSAAPAAPAADPRPGPCRGSGDRCAPASPGAASRRPVPVPLAVGGHHEPGRDVGRAARDRLVVGGLVVGPALALVDVALAELPVLRGIVEPGEEPLALLVGGDVQEALHDRRAALHDPPLERVDLVVPRAPGRLGHELVHPDDEDVLVVGAVEHHHLARLRQATLDAPQEMVRQLLGGRLLERRHVEPGGIHRDTTWRTVPPLPLVSMPCSSRSTERVPSAYRRSCRSLSRTWSSASSFFASTRSRTPGVDRVSTRLAGMDGSARRASERLRSVRIAAAS